MYPSNKNPFFHHDFSLNYADKILVNFDHYPFFFNGDILMNMFKITAVSTALFASLALVGCQSSQAMQQDQPRHEKSERFGFHKKGEREHGGLSRAQMQAFDQACAGKVGQTVNVTAGDKTLTGQCELTFQPEKHPKDKKHGYGGMMGEKSEKMGFYGKKGDKDQAEPMRDEKRAEHEQKMQQHQQFKATANQACIGKEGQKLTLKFDEKSITGECKVKFKFEHPKKPMPAM